ncbi:MAG: pyridoxal phosphate-dependent aminotransferase, partial [Candidatus Omnitrophota bacterium]
MSEFPFSNRTDWSLENNPLSSALESLRSEGCEILDLTESNPTGCGFVYPSGWLVALSNQNNLTYAPEDKGMLVARQAIAKYYKSRNLKVDPQDIVLTSGTSEGYSFLLKLLTNPNDHVLIPKPSYPLFQFLLELHDVRFDYYPLLHDGSWRIDRAAFKALVRDNTKAVILVNPNNPTGSYISAEDIDFLNEECVKARMAIISDEVFYDYQLNDQIVPKSLACNEKVLTFVLSGISKILGLPQMKLSWITVNGPNVVKEGALQRLEIIADTYLSVNTPVQNALSQWLCDARQIQVQIILRVQKNLEFLHQKGLNFLAVDGGWYAVIKSPSITY